MPIDPAEIQMFLSGGAGNTDPNASLGGVRSTTQLVPATLDNLFPEVTPTQAQNGAVQYRAVYILNNDPALTLQAAATFLQQVSASPDTEVALSVATEGINTTIQTIPNDTTAPAGQTFSEPTDFPSGLVIGNLPNGQFIGLWVRRTVTAGASALAIDNTIIRVQGGTAA